MDRNDSLSLFLSLSLSLSLQLESIHDKLTDDLTTCQEELTILRDKESKATKLVSELSTVKT